MPSKLTQLRHPGDNATLPRSRSCDMFSALEAAALLGISKRTLHRRLLRGDIPATKLPGPTGSYVIKRSVIETLIRSQQPAA